MKALQIRNVPEDIHAKLQLRAEAAGQSMQEYLLALLSDHASKLTVKEWVDMAARHASGSVTFEDIMAWRSEDREELEERDSRWS